jgi:hypothetical protein
MDFMELLIAARKVNNNSVCDLLSKATQQQALGVIELIVNTLDGNLELPGDVHQKLSKCKRILRKLGRTPDIEQNPNNYKYALVRHYKTVLVFLSHCLPLLKEVSKDYKEEEEEEEEEEQEEEEQEDKEVEEEEQTEQ